ncbi:hypothetical protein JW758_03910 [Candidatus Peregrinibacteria bacterium]|nr:hypothetical protein [Candidatus Peregrinibacteria bacterium]
MNSFIKIILGIAVVVFLIKSVVGILAGGNFYNNSLVYLFSFILLLLLPYVINRIKRKVFVDYLLKNYKAPKLFVILIIGIIVGLLFIWFKELPLLLILPWAYFLFSFIYVLDSRISALFAVVLLCYSLIFLILKEDMQAKAIADYAYIFLIILILAQIREYRIKKMQINE